MVNFICRLNVNERSRENCLLLSSLYMLKRDQMQLEPYYRSMYINRQCSWLSFSPCTHLYFRSLTFWRSLIDGALEGDF